MDRHEGLGQADIVGDAVEGDRIACIVEYGVAHRQNIAAFGTLRQSAATGFCCRPPSAGDIIWL